MNPSLIDAVLGPAICSASLLIIYFILVKPAAKLLERLFHHFRHRKTS